MTDSNVLRFRPQAYVSLCCILLGLLLLPLIHVPSFAYSSVEITIPKFSVEIDQVSRDNTYQLYPTILYKDITYFPLTYYDCQSLGLTSVWNPYQGLTITKREGAPVSLTEQLSSTPNPSSGIATIVSFPVRIMGTTIDNSKEEYPLLLYRNITYIPWTLKFSEQLGSLFRFDHTKGLRILSHNFVDSFPRLAAEMMMESYLEFTFEGDQYLVEINYPKYGLPWPDNLRLTKNGGEQVRLGDTTLYYGILSNQTDGDSTSMYSQTELKVEPPWIFVYATTEDGSRNGLFKVHVLTGETQLFKELPLLPE